MKGAIKKRKVTPLKNVFAFYCETSAALRRQVFEYMKDLVGEGKRKVLRFAIVSDDDVTSGLLKGRVSVLKKGIRRVSPTYYRYMKSLHVRFYDQEDLLDKNKRKKIMDSEQLLFLAHEKVDKSVAKKLLPHPNVKKLLPHPDVVWFSSEEGEDVVRPPWPISAMRIRENSFK